MGSGRAIWAEQLSTGELSALDPGVPERLDRRPDVLVVGGGILGVATAVACRDAEVGSVLLIEARHLGAGATGGAAGLLVPGAHQGTGTDALASLASASFARWRELEATAAGGVGLTDLDWLGLAPHPDGFPDHPSPAAERLSAAEVAQLLPGLAQAVPGVRIRHQGRVNPLRALSRLAAQVPQIATGVTATAVRVRGGRVLAVSSSAGVIAPGSVVFATGLPPELDGLGLQLPASLVKGHLAVTEPVSVVLPGSVAPVATQLEDGRLLAGGTIDADDLTTGVSAEVTDRIRAGLATAFPALRHVRLTHQWCCWRPRHPDGLPVIDRIPGLGNAWITSGHYRTGILLGPAAGSMLAQWIATGNRPANAAPWTIQREFSS
jgi:glycine oxidase